MQMIPCAFYPVLFLESLLAFLDTCRPIEDWLDYPLSLKMASFESKLDCYSIVIIISSLILRSLNLAEVATSGNRF